MIISCSSCEAKYLVDPVQLSKGRQVRCARCNFSWFQDNAGFENNESAPDSRKVLEKRDPQSDKNLPAVYKKKNKLSGDRIAIIIFILFIVLVLGIDHFNKLDPVDSVDPVGSVEALHIKDIIIKTFQKIFLPR
jgi:predicted Zn finger-like uncharacterized protein